MGYSWNNTFDEGYAKGSWKDDDAELDKYQMRGGVDPRTFLEYYGEEGDVEEYEYLSEANDDYEDYEVEDTDDKPVMYTFG